MPRKPRKICLNEAGSAYKFGLFRGLPSFLVSFNRKLNVDHFNTKIRNTELVKKASLSQIPTHFGPPGKSSHVHFEALIVPFLLSKILLKNQINLRTAAPFID